MMKVARIFTELVCGTLVISLGGCAYPEVKGQWQALESPVLVFSGVVLPEAVKDSAYPYVCVEAAEDINEELRRKLPQKLKPVSLLAEKPAHGDYAELQIKISECRLDSDQAGDNFTFYLDLNLHIAITDKGKPVMHYDMLTEEQAQTDTPSPAWVFTFEEPLQRTLMLFDNGNALVPQGGIEQ